MSDDYEFFKNKRPDRVYLSRSLSTKQYRRGAEGNVQEISRPFRIVSKVIDAAESHQFFRDGKQVSLRITDGDRQEIVAKFYEDTRDVFTLQIQRYTVETGAPHNTYFAFVNEEIAVLYNFLRNIAILPLRDENSAKLDDKFVSSLVLSREQAMDLFASQPELLDELVRTRISAREVAELGHRRAQLEEFERLMSDDAHFEAQRKMLPTGRGAEAVWQSFFERNTWIFGYGLQYVFNAPLEGSKLESVVRGHDFSSAGKRVDALLKTQGLVSALSLGEIKTHKSVLLKPVATAYRRECWQVSDEVAGGIAQIQRSVQASLANIRTKTEIKEADGSPTGEAVFLYQPRSFLVIGSLGEFRDGRGINEEKYSSFELFRRGLNTLDIITFDELYERAKYIVRSADSTTSG